MQLELTDEEMNVLAAGLGKLPFEVAAPVFSKIQQQVQDAVQKSRKEVQVPERTDVHEEASPAVLRKRGKVPNTKEG